MADINREVVRVNRERVALIRRKYKKDLEDKLGVKLFLHDETVTIEGDSEHVFFALPVIKAIARGFGMEKALRLKEAENDLFVINLRDFCNTENCVSRLKARVIGTEGKIKTAIENATDSHISVYGHTISIIAPLYSMGKAKEAVHMLLHGAKHSSLLNFLSRAKEELFLTKLKGDSF